MSPVLSDLPEILDSTVGDSPKFFEAMSGEAVLTLGVLLARGEAWRPWDILCGREYDCLAHGMTLIRSVETGKVNGGHSGLACQSFTFARAPPLRSLAYPLGLPHLRGHQLQLVEAGNSLASWTLAWCYALYYAGFFFSVENPVGSYLCGSTAKGEELYTACNTITSI